MTAWSGLSAKVQTNASFEPAIISAGQATLYRVDFSQGGSSTSFFNVSPPEVPKVDGLFFQYLGPNREIRIINGETSASVSHLFRVQPARPGDYEVPSFLVDNNGNQFGVPAAKLQVLAKSQNASGEEPTESRATWMEIQLPRENLYVGETTPAQVRLFLNSRQITNASLGAEHPEKIGDAFSIGEFTDMIQSQIAIDNRPMTVADWNVLLTPLKTGAQPLVFELPLIVQMRDSPRRPADPFDSFFGRSPFSRMFNQEQIRAYSEDREIEILPLPTKNRPTDFTGGIGRFAMEETTLSGNEVQVGEPLLYSITISGQGNFDRLEAPVLSEDSDDWREYDPETTFLPRDALGYTGAKTFTFTLVPLSEDIKATPLFMFSYFAPETGEYKTVSIPPSKIQVNPAPAGTLPPKAITERNPVETRRGPDLLPADFEWKEGSDTALDPVLFSKGFLVLQFLILGILLSLYALAIHRARLRDDPDYARRNRARRASRRFLAACANHASAKEVQAFYRSAARAIQESVGPFQKGEPESMTESDVINTLQMMGQSEGTQGEAKHFFSQTERIQFSGRTASTADLAEETERLQALVRSIHGKRKSRTSSGNSLALSILFLTCAVLGLAESSVHAQTPANTTTSEDAQTMESEDWNWSEMNPRDAYQKALVLYEAGEYEQAQAGFQSLLPDYASYHLYYNLGNTQHRLRAYPEAIVSYERAFVLAPTDPDIQANLSLTREAANVEAPVSPFLSPLGYQLSWNSWSWVLIIGFWGLLATLLFAKPLQLPGLWRNTLWLLFGVILILSLLGQATWFETDNRAIILAKDSSLRLAPTASSPVESRVSSGSAVTVLNSYGEFYRVRADSEATGWILQNAVEKIRP